MKRNAWSTAEKALRKTGYYKNFSVVGQSVFGANEEDEQASARCIPSKGLVFFVVSGSRRLRGPGWSG